MGNDQIEDLPFLPVRLVIVDDHEVLLDSLASSLDSRSALHVVATMTSLAAFHDEAGRHAPFDVVVVDYDLGDGRGTDLVDRARELGAAVLLLSGGNEETIAVAAAQSGCAGFVHKGSPLSELERAIQMVHEGGTVFSARALSSLTAVQSSDPVFTGRELEVLRLLGTGRSAGEISVDLFVSIHTTRAHIRSILSKMGASSQLDAVVKAVRSGVIAIGDDTGLI